MRVMTTMTMTRTTVDQHVRAAAAGDAGGLLTALGAAVNGAVHQYATRPPVPTDDQAAGYGRGSRWVDTRTGAEWRCDGGDVGVAIWRPTSGLLTLGTQTVPASKTDADTVETTLYSLTIPGGTVRPRDRLRVSLRVSTNVADATGKYFYVKLGGATMASGYLHPGLSLQTRVDIAARTDGSQIGGFNNSSAQVSFIATPFLVSAADLSQDTTLTVTVLWLTAGTGSGAITLETVAVDLLRSA